MSLLSPEYLHLFSYYYFRSFCHHSFDYADDDDGDDLFPNVYQTFLLAMMSLHDQYYYKCQYQ